VYKSGEDLKYIAEDEYEAKKEELPLLSLAIKYPIQKFEDKLYFDLKDLQNKLELEESKMHEGVRSNISNAEIGHDQPLYYSISKISGNL